jgi:hypothetical protein
MVLKYLGAGSFAEIIKSLFKISMIINYLKSILILMPWGICLSAGDNRLTYEHIQ